MDSMVAKAAELRQNVPQGLMPRQFRVPGINFPVPYLNPENRANNCVYATMAACLDLKLDEFMKHVDLPQPTDPTGVPLDYINFMLSRTNREYEYVSPYL